jgi:hypothetical protein
MIDEGVDGDCAGPGQAWIPEGRAATEAARALCADLFTTGGGVKADRLVLWGDVNSMSQGGRDLGGWGRRPFTDKLDAFARAQRLAGACELVIALGWATGHADTMADLVAAARLELADATRAARGQEQ